MNDVTVTIGNDLKFDVMRIDDQLLDINLFIPEGFLRLVTRAVKSRFEAWFIMRAAHPAPATAGSGFNHHRVTDLPCDFNRIAFRLDDPIASRRHWHAGFPGLGAGRIFIAHGLHRT